MLKTSLRTHSCGELTRNHSSNDVSLCGWVSTRRDHGGLIFIDLRDRYGTTQIVFTPGSNFFNDAEHLSREDVIRITGTVKLRPRNMKNTKIPTGEIEVSISSLEVLNKSKTPPIDVNSEKESSEEIRLKYRYLDLRRPKMQNYLQFRNDVMIVAREYFNKNKFIEIETPLLMKSTPEGARDYLVPSRVNPGKFYALPQSPQLYKQILMIAGFDRYYQFAKCLRDEDLRTDRQPEHTQMDLEMSFVTQEDILKFVSGLYKHIFKKIKNIDIGEIPVITYKETIEKYGTDKPDLRFNLELKDVTTIAKKSDFNIFKQAELIKALPVEKEFTRKEIDEFTELVSIYKAKGLAYVNYDRKEFSSGITKFLSDSVQKELISILKLKKNSTVFFIADKKKIVNESLANLRSELGKRLNLIKENDFKFCWVVDFPLFSYNEEENKWEPEHHMFTSPKPEHLKYLDSDPGKILGTLYDIVLNGTELGSGSIRINVPEIQEKVMKIIGMTKEQANSQFGFLLKAYEYAGPPHGGMGLGFDRLVALMLGIKDIREVIAFPKNKAAQDLMAEAPSEVDSKQLKELKIKLDLGK